MGYQQTDKTDGPSHGNRQTAEQADHQYQPLTALHQIEPHQLGLILAQLQQGQGTTLTEQPENPQQVWHPPAQGQHLAIGERTHHPEQDLAHGIIGREVEQPAGDGTTAHANGHPQQQHAAIIQPSATTQCQQAKGDQQGSGAGGTTEQPGFQMPGEQTGNKQCRYRQQGSATADAYDAGLRQWIMQQDLQHIARDGQPRPQHYGQQGTRQTQLEQYLMFQYRKSPPPGRWPQSNGPNG